MTKRIGGHDVSLADYESWVAVLVAKQTPT